MIRLMRVASYGVFRERSFELAPVTVVFGPNEAGKSTFFDALFEGICRPKRSQTAGKRLDSRYGKDRSVEITPSPTFSLPQDEFLGLMAIRGGDLRIASSNQTKWIDRLTHELFSGGIDPSQIARDLGKLASTAGTHRHVKTMRAFEQDRDEIQEEIGRLMERREKSLVRQKEHDSSARQLKDVDARLARSQKELEAIRDRIGAQRRHMEHGELRVILDRIEQRKDLDAKLSKLDPISSDESDELAALVAVVEPLQRELSENKALIERAQTTIDTAESERQDISVQVKGVVHKAELASTLRRYLEVNHQPPEQPSRLRLAGLAIAGLGITVGLVTGIVLSQALIGLITGGVLLVAGLLLAIVSPSTGYDPLAVVRQARDEWTRTIGTKLKSETAGGLIAEFVQIEQKSAQLRGEESKRADAVQRELSEIQLLESASKSKASRIIAAKEELSDWLATRGASSPTHYHTQRATLESLRVRRAEHNKQLQAYAERIGCEMDELRGECSVRAEALRQALPTTTMSEHEIQALESEERANEEETSTLRADREELSRQLATAAGELQGAFGDLPAQLVAWQRRLKQRELAIRGLVVDREAAQMALNLFDKIKSDNNFALADITKEIASSYGEIVGYNSELSLLGLTPEHATATDANGSPRGIEWLSDGTRDSFFLAARLALAERAFEEPPILVLDEPFVHLDSARSTAALKLIDQFRSRNGAQVVFLTMDDRTADQCVSHFSDSGRINLTANVHTVSNSTTE